MQHFVYSDNFYRNWSWFSGKAALLRFCHENFCPLVCQLQHLARIADIFQKCLRTRKEKENLLKVCDNCKKVSFSTPRSDLPFRQNTKMVIFLKTEVFGQTVLPDRSSLLIQIHLKTAKIQMRHFWVIFKQCVFLSSLDK